MTKGIVKWFNATKCLGFIQPEGSDRGMRFFSPLEASRPDSQADGQDVSFTIETDIDGRQFAASIAVA